MDIVTELKRELSGNSEAFRLGVDPNTPDPLGESLVGIAEFGWCRNYLISIDVDGKKNAGLAAEWFAQRDWWLPDFSGDVDELRQLVEEATRSTAEKIPLLEVGRKAQKLFYMHEALRRIREKASGPLRQRLFSERERLKDALEGAAVLNSMVDQFAKLIDREDEAPLEKDQRRCSFCYFLDERALRFNLRFLARSSLLKGR